MTFLLSFWGVNMTFLLNLYDFFAVIKQKLLTVIMSFDTMSYLILI